MEWTFGTFLWSMIVFFFWFTFIWMFVTLFADVFRRHDLSGWAKAGWSLLLVVLPVLGALIYLIARPKDVPGYYGRSRFDYYGEYDAGSRRATSGQSAAEEIARAAELEKEGKITPAEFDQLKQQALSY